MIKVLSFVMLAAVLGVTVSGCTGGALLGAAFGAKYERNGLFDNNCSHHALLPAGDGFCEKYTAGK